MWHISTSVTFLFVCFLSVNANAEPKTNAEQEAKPSYLYEHEMAEPNYDEAIKSKMYQEDRAQEESRIVEDVYSPDYYEPNIILDYRYLKSGGRGYTVSDGGQILILPRRNKLPISYNSYDTLLEYLRLRRMADVNKMLRDSSNRKYKGGAEQYLDTLPGYFEAIEGNVGRQEKPMMEYNRG